MVTKFDKTKKFPKILDLSDLENVDLSGCDLSGVEEIKFNSRKKFSRISVNLSGAKNLPKKLDFSGVDFVNLVDCDLSQVEELKFKDGAELKCGYTKDVYDSNLRKDLRKIDFTKFKNVALHRVHVSSLNELKFREGANVSLDGCYACSKEVLEFSNLSVISFTHCDLYNVENIKLNECKNVNMDRCKLSKELEEELDFSGAENVSLWYMYLKNVKNLKFKEGANARFWHTEMPAKLDCSNLQKVDFDNLNMEDVKEIKFREDGEARFYTISGFDENLDISSLGKVVFADCDLSKFNKLVCKKGSSFNASSGIKGYPKVLDVSQCREVILNKDEYIGNLRKVIFKNRGQSKEAYPVEDFRENLAGQLVYGLIRRAKFRYREGRIAENLNKIKRVIRNDGQRDDSY